MIPPVRDTVLCRKGNWRPCHLVLNCCLMMACPVLIYLFPDLIEHLRAGHDWMHPVQLCLSGLTYCSLVRTTPYTSLLVYCTRLLYRYHVRYVVAVLYSCTVVLVVDNCTYCTVKEKIPKSHIDFSTMNESTDIIRASVPRHRQHAALYYYLQHSFPAMLSTANSPIVWILFSVPKRRKSWRENISHT